VGLFAEVSVAIDGSKFKAVNNHPFWVLTADAPEQYDPFLHGMGRVDGCSHASRGYGTPTWE
jgi:hypothetical protein